MTQQRPHATQQPSGKGRGSKRASFVARHEWTLLGILAILTFVLGCIGYAQTISKPSTVAMMTGRSNRMARPSRG